MAVVIAILAMVMMAGIGLRNDAPAAVRRTAVDLLSASADHARTTAIARRKPVVMALAAPADLPAGDDGRCRIGLFVVDAEEGTALELTRTVTALGRWKPLGDGISWGTGQEAAAVNPWNAARLKLRTKRGPLQVHGIVFTPQGGLSSPPGAAPAEIRFGQSGGRAEAFPASRLRVGRVTGRIYPADP